jgi:hypothetical protein
LKFLLSDKAESLRNLLEPEVDTIVDILTRQIFRQGVSEAVVALTPPRPPALPFLGDILPPSPKLDEIPLPWLLPGAEGFRSPSVSMMTIQQLKDAVAPKLSTEDELFALGLADAAEEFFGPEIAEFVRGESVFSTQSVEILLGGLRSGVVGRIDALSPKAVETVVNSVSRMLSLSRGSSASSSASSIEKLLQDAISNLDSNERERLDRIIDELTRRSIARSLERLSTLT